MGNKLYEECLKFYSYLKKDFLLLIKRKKYLYLSIAIPLLLALIFLIMLNPSSYSIKMGVCDYDNTAYSRLAYTDLSSFEPTLLPQENCSQELIKKIKQGEFSLGLRVGKGFAQDLENLQQTHITIFYDNTDIAFSNLVAWKVDSALTPFKREIINQLNTELKNRIALIRESVDLIKDSGVSRGIIEDKINEIDKDLSQIENLETEFIVNPIWVSHNPIYEQSERKNTGIIYVFPIIALFIVLMMASTSLIYDIKNNFLTSVKSSTTIASYLLAKIIFFLVIIFVQFLIIMLLFILYGASYQLNFIGILNLVLFVGVINTLIGLLIGIVSDNEGIAILFSLLISFPLMLLSGIFYPSQTFPRIFQWFSDILPLSYQIDAVRNVLLFGQNFSYNWVYVALVGFVLVYYLLRRRG